ncbi:MAG: L-glutamate gamma-semialdehyde dehydrogenase, partial [Cyanobacteria bacterium P01_E01_bin.34]
ADLRNWVAWAKTRGTPVTVRLVKGAYWDSETIRAIQNHWPQPVFNSKELTDANFEWLTQELLEHHKYLYAAIGSHNIRSQAKAIAIARQLNIPSRRIELQVLYGMADELAKALVEQGMRVRVYAPSGQLIPGMSYLIRRLLENTANTSFLKQRVGKVADEVLLAEPSDRQTEPPLAEYEPQFKRAPLSDFSQVDARNRAFEAIQTVRQQLGQTYHPLIDGEWIDTDRQIESLNPSRPSEVIGRVNLCGLPALKRAIAAAKAALPGWRATAVTERSTLLRRIADRMEARQAELAAWIVLEVGKPLEQADADVTEAIDFCRYYAYEIERLEAGERYDLPGETNRYRYRSRGITVVISPWNFPLAIPTGMTVASLVTGNCTILKPSQQSCVTAAKLAEIVLEAGVPSGVFQFVPGSGSEVGRSLVRSPNVHTIVFTGSQQVGCEIYAEAAVLQPGQRHLKRTIAEMGGKNAIIVDASADIDKAVQGVVQSAFGYSGQKCSACSRVIVLQSVYDEFLHRLVDATRSLSVGPADLPDTVVGPVINEVSQQRIRDAIVSAKTEATLALELAAPDEGCFVEPTIFTDVYPDSDLAQREIFGPVLAVLRADTFDEAIAIANSTPYALTGGLYSRTPSHIEQAQQDFEVGNLYINRGITGAIVGRQPFGGFKLSGVGSKAGGPDYLLQFLEPQTVTENVQRQGFAPIKQA